jgi:hypothetical protein
MGALALAFLSATPADGLAKRRTTATALPQRVVKLALGQVSKSTADADLVRRYGKDAYTCADFVAWVMHQVKAKSTEDFHVSGFDPNLNYVWGKLVVQHDAGKPAADFKKIRPGHVLQFRNVEGPKTGKFSQHTAIVYRNLGKGRLVLLQQNYNNQKFVSKDTIDFSGMTSGTLWVYRPVTK